MAILVDEAIWPWRGRMWAHLVSDDAYDELHDFARELGLRRVGFQGDHYDVDEAVRVDALALGAVATPSRELVRRLRASGLRYRGSAEWSGGVARRLRDLDEVVDHVRATLASHPDADELIGHVLRFGPAIADAPIRVLHRAFEAAVIVDFDDGPIDLVAGSRHRGDLG